MLFDAFLLGLAVTVGGPLGASIGLLLPLPRRLLGCVLAFGAGALISSVAIELGLASVERLMAHRYDVLPAWALVSCGFLAGAALYTAGSLWLDSHGASIRSPFRLRQSLEEEKRERAERLFPLLANSPLLANLPPEEMGRLVDCVEERKVPAGDAVFHQGDPGDALYILVAGKAEVAAEAAGEAVRRIALLGPGDAFGEMALLAGGHRTAGVLAIEDLALLRIGKADFDRLVEDSPALMVAVEKLGHGRALENLRSESGAAQDWSVIASAHVERLSRREMDRGLHEAPSGAGSAILFGNFLDVTPAAFAIGANFESWQQFSLPLALGIFMADLPEGGTSAAMMRRAGFRGAKILRLWLAVMLIGACAAVLGHLTVGAQFSVFLVLAEAFAGGAVLSLVSRTLIPEAMEEAGAVAVLPLILGFLLSLGVVLHG
jgi:CRP-like cAMP-binding protein